MEHPPPERLKTLELFAWVGEDELGSGVVGLKQGLVPAGYIPLVATTASKIERPEIAVGLGVQASLYGKRIYLCRFAFVEVVNETAAGTPL